MTFSFPKNEKLKSRKVIELLFTEGKSISKFPLRLVFIQTSFHDETQVKAGFSVPKRKFKKAVDRNRIKRYIREAYRLNKGGFFNNLSTSYAFMFLYIGKEEPSFDELNKTMGQLLTKFLKNTHENETK